MKNIKLFILTLICWFCFLNLNNVFAEITTATNLKNVGDLWFIEKEWVLDKDFITSRNTDNIKDFLTNHKNNLKTSNNSLFDATLTIWVRAGSTYYLFFKNEGDMYKWEFIANNLSIDNACHWKANRFYKCAILPDNLIFTKWKDYYIRLYDESWKNNFVFDICPAEHNVINWECTFVWSNVNAINDWATCNSSADDAWDSTCNATEICVNNTCKHKRNVSVACMYGGDGPSWSWTCSLNINLSVSTSCEKNFTTRTYKKFIWPNENKINSYKFTVHGKNVYAFISTWKRTEWEIFEWKSDWCKANWDFSILTCDMKQQWQNFSNYNANQKLKQDDEVYLSIRGVCWTNAQWVEENLENKYTSVNINYNASYLRK